MAPAKYTDLLPSSDPRQTTLGGFRPSMGVPVLPPADRLQGPGDRVWDLNAERPSWSVKQSMVLTVPNQGAAP